MSEWKTVSVRQELIKEIESIVRIGQYRSISEFISEAIRLRVGELRRAQASPTDRYQELLAKEDTIARTTLNLKEEKAWSSQSMPSKTSQPQTPIETQLVQRKTQAIQKWPMNPS